MSALPRWDLTNVYPSLESNEFAAAITDVQGQLEALSEFLALTTTAPATEIGERLAEGIGYFNTLLRLEQTIHSYLYSFGSTDSRNTAARKKISEFNQVEVQSETLFTQWQAWVG